MGSLLCNRKDIPRARLLCMAPTSSNANSFEKGDPELKMPLAAPPHCRDSPFINNYLGKVIFLVLPATEHKGQGGYGRGVWTVS